MTQLHRTHRVLILAVIAVLVALATAGSSSAHQDDVSVHLPDMASELSDPLQVHMDQRTTLGEVPIGGAWWYDSKYERAQAGCPAYEADDWDETGAVTHITPTYDFCATDRISMFEHSRNCNRSYARFCVESIMPAKLIPRGRTYSMYGVLSRYGQPEPARAFRLERRVLGIESDFSPFRTHLTETEGEIGSVRMEDVSRSKVAYRWAVRNDSTREWVYSTVPQITRVQPTITYIKVSKRRLQRQERFVTTIRTDVPIWGVAKVEYRYGNRWIQVSRVYLRGKRAFTIPGRINRTSGTFPLRVHIARMSTDGRRHYDPATRGAGSVKVLTSWFVQ